MIDSGMGNRLFLSLNVRVFRLLYLLPEVGREEREWSICQTPLTIPPPFLMHCTVNMDWIKGSDDLDRAELAICWFRRLRQNSCHPRLRCILYKNGPGYNSVMVGGSLPAASFFRFLSGVGFHLLAIRHPPHVLPLRFSWVAFCQGRPPY